MPWNKLTKITALLHARILHNLGRILNGIDGHDWFLNHLRWCIIDLTGNVLLKGTLHRKFLGFKFNAIRRNFCLGKDGLALPFIHECLGDTCWCHSNCTHRNRLDLNKVMQCIVVRLLGGDAVSLQMLP